jgi:hypothetical protein
MRNSGISELGELSAGDGATGDSRSPALRDANKIDAWMVNTGLKPAFAAIVYRDRASSVRRGGAHRRSYLQGLAKIGPG